MTDRTEAMDNLIAQDADLIEIRPEDLVTLVRQYDIPICNQAADRIEAQAAEIERLNKSAECLAESRRLAVKDLAVLEEHMRLETGQWKVDYDCAIRDVERLRDALKIARDAINGLLDIAPEENLDSEQAGRAFAALHEIGTALAALEQSQW